MKRNRESYTPLVAPNLRDWGRRRKTKLGSMTGDDNDDRPKRPATHSHDMTKRLLRP